PRRERVKGRAGGPDRRAPREAAAPARRPPPRAARVVSARADTRFMARALALAAEGLGRTFPNPPVGAVFARGGRVVGEGFHRRAGAPPAEIVALRAAGRRG